MLKSFADKLTLAVLIFACVVFFFFPSLAPHEIMRASVSSSNSSSSQRQVVYKATTSLGSGCNGIDTTYEMPSGTSQKTVSMCKGKTSAVVDQRTGSRGDFVYLAVQNDKMFARIGCEIYVDGKLVHQTHSEGQYVIASCSGSID
jgi:hypothetical protein